jgi:RimJ/RimL family protein N-acetyltransferase
MRCWTRPDGRTFVFGEPDAELPAGELYASADEADAQRRAALEALGFVVERRELVLELPTAVGAAAPPPGVSLVPADAVPADELRLLDDELRQDVPGTGGWRWDAVGFREETYESPDFDPALYLVARDDAAERWIGIARVWNRPGRARLGFVGVSRTQRRRGIAKALVVAVLAALRERGVERLTTEVDEENAASRALLEGLGGRPVGASLELRRPG